MVVLGGEAVSYERGTPVKLKVHGLEHVAEQVALPPHGVDHPRLLESVGYEP